MIIRRLTPADAAAFVMLRLDALRECPTAFGSSYEEEVGLPIAVTAERFAPDSGRNMFGAFEGDALVGTVGVGRETPRKLSHKGFIAGMYVAPALRGRGVGKALVAHALEHAATMPGVRQLLLSVNVANLPALALYKAMGFVTYGVEPDALCVDGVLHDEVRMLRILAKGES